MAREIRSYPRTPFLQVLTPEQERAVHQHSLEVLQRVGVTTTNRKLLELMAAHGQQVDLDAKRIRFDPAFVEERIALAPERFTMAARDPNLDLPLGGDVGWLTTDGCPASVIDLETGKRRYSTKQDVADIARVADALPQIGMVWQSAAANDKPVPVRPMHETHAQFPVTSKHIMQMTAIDPFNARGLVEMAQVIAGGAEQLRARPIMSNFQCSISPLHWDEPTVDALEVFAAAGLPVGICSMPLAAASAPLSVAGLMTIANAEILSGIVILETLVPGAKTFYVSYNTTIDLNSGELNPAWGPHDIFAEMACTQMSRFYKIPNCAGAYGTGSKASDWQSGVQNALAAFGAILMPGDMLTGVGSLHGDSVYSLAELLLSCEIFDIVSRWAVGFPFRDEDFAVDTIEAVGPTGHFLDQDHTLANMREFWRDTFMDRRNWEDWEAQGRPTPHDAATAKAKEILATHEPDPLPEDVARELDRIMESYEAQAVGQAS